MPTKEELIASIIASEKDYNRAIDKIREKLGADSLRYLTIQGLIEAIGKNESELCLGCLTGVYPVKLKPYEQVKLIEYI